MADALNLAKADKVVSINYTLTSSTGEVLDRSEDAPLSYLHGHENIVPGLEKQIEGRKVGDSFTAVVLPKDGYGERDPRGQQEVPREAFPEGAEIEVGMQFAAEAEDGEEIPMWVRAVSTDSVTVDLNHPLAGETLTFEVEIVDVRDALPEELQHGHVHGPGGHHHH